MRTDRQTDKFAITETETQFYKLRISEKNEVVYISSGTTVQGKPSAVLLLLYYTALSINVNLARIPKVESPTGEQSSRPEGFKGMLLILL